MSEGVIGSWQEARGAAHIVAENQQRYRIINSRRKKLRVRTQDRLLVILAFLLIRLPQQRPFEQAPRVDRPPSSLCSATLDSLPATQEQRYAKCMQMS